jgi:ribosome biogenesis GTPase
VSEVARIAIDDGVAYVAWGAGGTVSVRLSGKMLREVRAGTLSRPVVGDFVTIASGGVIEAISPRRTRLARKAAGLHDVEQVIAANVDIAFIATAAGNDLNERRLERYLSIVHDGGVEPVVLLTKVDTSVDAEADATRLRRVASGLEVIAVSATTGLGVDEVARRIGPDRVAVILGSSGVGKSTLVNRLVGEARQKIGALRDDGKGRHTTTRRELFVLPTGGMLLDTPGMRELGLLDADEGLADTFPDVAALVESCKYRDCSHTSEPACAIREALETRALTEERLASWKRLHEELSGRRRRR